MKWDSSVNSCNKHGTTARHLAMFATLGIQWANGVNGSRESGWKKKTRVWRREWGAGDRGQIGDEVWFSGSLSPVEGGLSSSHPPSLLTMGGSFEAYVPHSLLAWKLSLFSSSSSSLCVFLCPRAWEGQWPWLPSLASIFNSYSLDPIQKTKIQDGIYKMGDSHGQGQVSSKEASGSH